MKLILKYARPFSKKAAGKAKAEISPEAMAEFASQRVPHQPNRNLPIAGARNILVTSALPYVNNTPHLGNIIGAVLSADVYARFCRLMGHNVMFICGTDEYGTATEVKALKEGKTPRAICDHFHAVHRNIYEWFGISFDHFGRTSRPAHTNITQDIFARLLENGAVEQKTSEQLYCQHCDLFLADRFVLGKCRKCGTATRGDQCEGCSAIFDNLAEELTNLACSVCSHTPAPRQTTHFYLKLAAQSDALKKWLVEERGMENWTNNAKGVTRSWLNSPA
jgi:methionyl-tRNA synthetase